MQLKREVKLLIVIGLSTMLYSIHLYLSRKFLDVALEQISVDAFSSLFPRLPPMYMIHNFKAVFLYFAEFDKVQLESSMLQTVRQCIQQKRHYGTEVSHCKSSVSRLKHPSHGSS